MINVFMVGMVLFQVIVKVAGDGDPISTLFPFSLARGRNVMNETRSVNTMDNQMIVSGNHQKLGVALASTKCTTATSCTTTGNVNSGWVYIDSYGLLSGSNSYYGPISGVGCPPSLLFERRGRILGVCSPQNNNPVTYSVFSANITAKGTLVGIYQDYYGTSSTCNTAAINTYYNDPGYFRDYHGNFNTSSCFLKYSNSNNVYASVHYSTSPPPDPILINPSGMYDHKMFYLDNACGTAIAHDFNWNNFVPPAGSPSPTCILELCSPANGKCIIC